MSDDSADIRIADAARVEEHERGYETQVKENELYQDGGPGTEDQCDVDESTDRVSHGPSEDELENNPAEFGRGTPAAPQRESPTPFKNRHASDRSPVVVNVSGCRGNGAFSVRHGRSE